MDDIDEGTSTSWSKPQSSHNALGLASKLMQCSVPDESLLLLKVGGIPL